jgi:hypothetical protein
MHWPQLAAFTLQLTTLISMKLLVTGDESNGDADSPLMVSQSLLSESSTSSCSPFSFSIWYLMRAGGLNFTWYQSAREVRWEEALLSGVADHQMDM